MEPMFNNQEEVDFLLKYLKPDSLVLEWGSGGSTIEIAKRVKQLVSIEHLKEWHDKVSAELERLNLRNKVRYPHVPSNSEEAPGDDGSLDNFYDYVKYPMRLIRLSDTRFDVIFIDGRARLECAKEANHLLKRGGVILIHDCFHPNPQYRRPEYEAVLDFLDHIGGAFTLQAFRPKHHSKENNAQNSPNTQIKMEDQNTAAPDPKAMCWYRDDCAADMNRFYDKHLKDQDINKHMEGFTNLLALVEPKGTPLIDLGTGTAMISEFCKEFHFVGADLPHILKDSAMRNYPQYMYRACDLLVDDLEWISGFPVVVANGLIDIMPNALDVLMKILEHTSNYLLIHRQEITEQGKTHQIVNGSYTGETFHSIISRTDFNLALDRMCFTVVKQENLPFGNWENGGCSFLLQRKRSYSLNRIDHKLHSRLFYDKNRDSGTFIEAGANDGIKQSNTLFLEENNHWVGILVEPVLEVWKECRANRSSRDVCINAALVADDYKQRKLVMCHLPGTSGLMSVVKDGNEQKHLDRLRGQTVEVVEREAPAMSLNSLLAMIWDEQIVINLFSLDVEGYEKNVLRGIDFSKWLIEYLLIEQREENNDILELIGGYYELLEKLSPQDYLYKRKPSKV